MSGFASVKLSTDLVDQARESAHTLRRSVASQIEYWALLGQAVEHAGLTVQEAQQAISGFEARRAAGDPSDPAVTSRLGVDPFTDPLLRRFVVAEADGSLARRVREVIADNRGRALAAKSQ